MITRGHFQSYGKDEIFTLLNQQHKCSVKCSWDGYKLQLGYYTWNIFCRVLMKDHELQWQSFCKKHTDGGKKGISMIIIKRFSLILLTPSSPSAKRCKVGKGEQGHESRLSVSCRKNDMTIQSGEMRKFDLWNTQRTEIHRECDLWCRDHLLQGSCAFLE